MEGGELKTAFFVLILCSLALFTVFSTTAGDLWVQTDQVDFEAGERIKVDTETVPGNVTLSRVWTKFPTGCILDVGVPGSWDDVSVKFPRVCYDGMTYHMWYTGNDGTTSRIGHATSSDGFQWTKDAVNPVLNLGSPGSWDQSGVYFSSVIYTGSGFQMWFSGDNGITIRIGYATSPDGVTWSKYPGNPVLDIGPPGSWDDKFVFHPEILYDGMTYHLWYNGQSGLEPKIGYATSPDGITWTKYQGNPVLDWGPPGSWDSARVRDAFVYYDGSDFRMWYTGASGVGGQIGHAVSKDGINWTKDPANPVLDVGLPGTWDDVTVYTPSVLVEGSTYRMWYTGHSGSTWKLGYAESDDGYTWTKIPPKPVLDAGPPTVWDDGYVWTPSVVHEGGTYHMWYTGWDQTYNRIGYATSSDGITWSKYGSNPVINLGPGGTWDDDQIYTLSVIYNGTGYEMWYAGGDGTNTRIGYAYSSDGFTWTKPDLGLISYGGNSNNNIVLDIGSSGSWDDYHVWWPSVIFDGSDYYMWYIGNDGSGNNGIGYATSPGGVIWTRYASNPVFSNGSAGEWDGSSIVSPNVYFDGKLYYMFYGGNDGSKTRIGYAVSDDGITWTRNPANPVLNVSPSGFWDDTWIYTPSVLHDGTTLKMWYTGADGSTRKIGYAEFLHYQRGNLTSSVFDSGADGTVWNSINWTENLPLKTNITVATRTGNVSVPDGSWSAWSPEMWDETGVTLTSPRSRYIQYRATLYTSDRYVTPTLSEVVIDYDFNTAQAPTLSLPNNNTVTSNSTPTFEWSFNDPEGDSQDEFLVQVDDDPLFFSVDYTSGSVVSILEEWTPGAPISDGIWFWRVRTMDEYGLWSNWSENWTVTIDTTPPEPFVPAANPGSWTNNTQPEIIFSTIDSLSGISHYEVRIDTGSFTTQTSPFTLPSQTDGIHNITIRAFDVAGNYRDGYVEVFIDTTPPAAPADIITIPDTWTNTNSFSINWTYPSEVNTSGIKSGAWYKIGSPPVDNSDGTWQANKPITVISIEGVQTIYMWLEDNIGNVNYTLYNTTILHLDMTPPDEFSPMADPAVWTNNTQPEITFSTTDAPSGIDHYEVQIDAGGFTTQTSPYTIPAQTDGIHNITVRAFDMAGNYRDGYVEVFIDTTPPEPFIPTANPSSWTNNTQPEITFSTTDSPSGIDHYEVQIDTGGFTTQTSPYIIPSQGDGIHNITVRAFDVVGNYGDGHVEVFIDTTPPEAPINVAAIPDTWTNINSFSVDWTNPSEVNTSGIKDGAWYKIGSPPVNNSDGTWQANKPITVTSIEGAQTIYVWLEDNVGNLNYTHYNTTILYLDITPPDTFSPTADPDDWTADNQPRITFSTADVFSGISHYEIKVDSGGFTTQASPYALPAQTDGTHTITVRAYDNVGFYIEGTVDIYIDTTPPETPTGVSTAPDSWTNINSFEIEWTEPTESDTSGIKTGAWYKIGSSPTSNSDGSWIAVKPLTVSSLEGQQTIYIWLEDNVGNVDYLNYATTTLYLDTTPPQAPIDLTPTPSIWTNINSFSLEWTNPADDSGIKTGAWYKFGSAPTSNSDGTWVGDKPFNVTSFESDQLIYVWLEDNLGNVDCNNHASTTLYLDTTPPAPPTGLTASPSNWTIANSFSIDWIDPADDSGVKTGAMYKIDTPPSSESDGTWFDDKPISITSLEGEHTVYIWLEDNVGNTNHLNYSTVVLYLDSTAPSIVHTAVTKADIGKDLTITATVTDNVAVKSARLHYRKPGDETFEIIDMSNVGDVYSAVIPSSFVTTDGIEYYISASDEINTATHPSSNAITEPLPIEVEDDEEPLFISLWWLFLLLAIILIILFLLLALRRDEEEGGNGAIAQEEPVSEHMGDTTTGEEPTLPETAVHETPEREPVPPTPPPSMSDDEIFDQIKQLHEKGELSDETFEDIKKRYGK